MKSSLKSSFKIFIEKQDKAAQSCIINASEDVNTSARDWPAGLPAAPVVGARAKEHPVSPPGHPWVPWADTLR